MDNHEELELEDMTKEIPDLEETKVLPSAEEISEEVPEETGEEVPEAEEEVPAVTSDTIRLDTLGDIEPAQEAPEDAVHVEEEEPEEETEGEEAVEPFSEGWEPEYEEPIEDYVPPKKPIVYDPRAKLRELKKKLIAGPEKRYYDLTEIGVGKLQLSIFLNLLIVLLCAGAGALFAGGAVPENRMRLLIFSQMLAMLLSALLGCYALLDGAADLLKGKFSVNTMLLLTFIACCVDVVFCLRELRVPCCAAFSLEVVMALWQRYHKRTAEMGQMDTLRKATRLNSLVRTKDYYDGQDGLLRSQGEVEDFMDHYEETPAPEKTQCIYTFVSFLLCIGIAVFAGLLHGASMGVRIFATSLLVATPASFFVCLSRPMAVLERRLHMVGTVICGWRGIKGLSGRVVFPLKDSDLFPQGSTKLNGVKFYGDRNPDVVVAYAAALIRENGGNLSPLFGQLLSSRQGKEYDVVNFRDYGRGGIGGEVCDEPVLLGTMNFLQDMGVEIPEGTMVNQAVYCSIDGELSAVFAINYARAKSAAAGMVSLCGYRKLTPVMLCDDFMLGESFLRSKFSVNSKRIAFPQREVREELSQRKPDEDAVTLAITTQDGLASYAYAATGARVLRTACRIGLGIHMFGGILGMLIMLVIAYLGASSLLTPLNVLLYQLVWLIPGVLATNWTKIV